MLDFIVENIWILIIVGVIIILTTIGYIVDKFVINKDNSPKKEKEDAPVQEKADIQVEETANNEESTQEVAHEGETNQEIPDAANEVAEGNQEQVPENSEVPDVAQETEASANQQDDDNLVKTEPLFSKDDNGENKEEKQEV